MAGAGSGHGSVVYREERKATCLCLVDDQDTAHCDGLKDG